jgi:hypothetical protein
VRYNFTMRPKRGLCLAGVAVVAASVAGCDAQSEPAATAVAERFATAVADEDGAAACRLLAPPTKSQLEQSSGKDCASALLEEELPDPGAAEGSSSFGTMAEVSFSSDTIFVAEFPGGWRVLAAGCSPVPGKPYDCQLEGG